MWLDYYHLWNVKKDEINMAIKNYSKLFRGLILIRNFLNLSEIGQRELKKILKRAIHLKNFRKK